jgi:hypothetical protein
LIYRWVLANLNLLNQKNAVPTSEGPQFSRKSALNNDIAFFIVEIYFVISLHGRTNGRSLCHASVLLGGVHFPRWYKWAMSRFSNFTGEAKNVIFKQPLEIFSSNLDMLLLDRCLSQWLEKNCHFSLKSCQIQLYLVNLPSK